MAWNLVTDKCLSYRQSGYRKTTANVFRAFDFAKHQKFEFHSWEIWNIRGNKARFQYGKVANPGRQGRGLAICDPPSKDDLGGMQWTSSVCWNYESSVFKVWFCISYSLCVSTAGTVYMNLHFESLCENEFTFGYSLECTFSSSSCPSSQVFWSILGHF